MTLRFGYARESSVNAVLKQIAGDDGKLTTKYTVDLSRRPSCTDILLTHASCTSSASPTTSELTKRISPQHYDIGQDWEKTEDGMFETLWSCVDLYSPLLLLIIGRGARRRRRWAIY